MLNNLGGPHLLIILAIFILIFGATKLPALAKSIGQSVKIFKGEIKTGDSETVAVPTDAPAHITTKS